jgi:hypothetical protein
MCDMSILCIDSVFRHITNGLELPNSRRSVIQYDFFFARIAQNGIPFRVFNSPALGWCCCHRHKATCLHSTVMDIGKLSNGILLILGSLYAAACINT